MKKKSILIVFVLIFMFIFYINLNISSKNKNDLGFCKQNSDCKTPTKYLIQSNCPFSSACINEVCRVICPMTYHDKNSSISKSYSSGCKINNDCDCSWRMNKTLECLCLNGSCVSVEE